MIAYRDQNGAKTERVIWPLFIAFMDQLRIVPAWCETRNAFRHFRTDRIEALHDTGAQFPEQRDALIRRWQAQDAVAQDYCAGSCR